MNKFKIASLILVAAGSFVSHNALALPVTWYLQNVVVVTGEVATGSFVYDRDSNTYSSVNIAVTGGRGGPYTVPVLSTPAVLAAAEAPTAIGKFIFAITATAPLTNAGGTIPLWTGALQGGFYNCVDAGCTVVSGQEVAGHAQLQPGSSITTVAPLVPQTVPSLSAYGLMALSMLLAALGIRQARQRKT